MSTQSTHVGAELFHYIRQHTLQEDDFLRDLKTAAREAGLPEIWIAPEQGALMHILLRLIAAKVVVEIGTLAGYSAIWLARALPDDGRLSTIEVSGSRADFAEAWIAKSDVAAKIKVFRGQGLEILPRFRNESADAAFIDADKVNYPAYLAECQRIIRRGGLILVDNGFAYGQLLDDSVRDANVVAMRAFNELLARQRALFSIIVPLGDGCWVGVKA